MKELSENRKSRRTILKQAGAVMLGTATSGFGQSNGLRLTLPEAWTLHGEQSCHTGEPKGGWVQNSTSTVEALPNDRWRVWTRNLLPQSQALPRQAGPGYSGSILQGRVEGLKVSDVRQ